MASPTGPQPTLTESYMRQGVRMLTLIGVLLLIAFCFFASSICIAIVLAAFLALLADPAVQVLERFGIPRFVAAGLVVLVGALAMTLLAYGAYAKAAEFSDNFEIYANRIHELVAPISSRVEHVRESAGELIHETAPREAAVLPTRESPSWTTYLVRGVGSMGGALVIGGVVPFLVFFMLLVREKLYVVFKALAGARLDIDSLLEKVKGLVIGYTIGNIFIGALMSAASVIVFWRIGLKPALPLGIVSGILNLVPFVGLVLALAVPLVAGLVQFHGTSQFLMVIAVVVLLHLITENLLLPRFVGSRLDVGPVAASVGLLFWGWLWGVAGILLAVPLTAVMKLLADSHPALAHLSNLLARNPHRMLRRRVATAAPEVEVAMKRLAQNKALPG